MNFNLTFTQRTTHILKAQNLYIPSILTSSANASCTSLHFRLRASLRKHGILRRRRRKIKMSRTIHKSVLLSVLAVVCLLPASSCCFSSLARAVLDSFGWYSSPNASQEAKVSEPICSCALLTEPCPLYILHDAPEPYCPPFTRYCCQLEPIIALVQPRNVTDEGILASRISLARSGRAASALKSCKCRVPLLPCHVQIYSTIHTSSELFNCTPYFHFCCSIPVLRDVILPFVANQHQELFEKDTQGQNEPQVAKPKDSGSWWRAAVWIW